MLLAADRSEHRRPIRRQNISVRVVCSRLTVSPELEPEPARPGLHPPALGAVQLAGVLGEGHGGEHVRHVVALVAHLDLRAGLQPRRREEMWSS